MSNVGLNRTKTSPELLKPNGRANVYNSTYIGIVKSNTDPLRMNRIQVYIPDLGADPTDSNSWYWCNFVSPFGGATPVSDNKKDGKQYTQSQTSYGFWYAPPDIDNEVIVLFLNGDPNKGIWIGCLYQQYMNHMVPGIPINLSYDDSNNNEKYPPVVEYNKKSSEGNKGAPVTNGDTEIDAGIIRPRFDPLHNGLTKQGLYNDPERGPSSTGARRESPSKVYGLLSKRSNTIHIDDNECNEFIRLRTRSGVQILIHETEGYIYMNSKNGNSWMQISDDGIDMYSAKGINHRTPNNHNQHIDGDYNLHINGNYNIFVSGKITYSVVGNKDELIGGDYKRDIAGSLHSTIKGHRYFKIDGTDNLTVSGKLSVKSNGELGLTSSNNIDIVGKNINLNSGPASAPILPQSASTNEPTQQQDTKLEQNYPSDYVKSVSPKVPTHEPYDNRSSSSPAASDNTSNVSPKADFNSDIQNKSTSSNQTKPVVISDTSSNNSSLQNQQNNITNTMGKVISSSGQGSGVLIDNSGTFVTAAHVLIDNNGNIDNTVNISLAGSNITGTISSYDKSKDIAIIKLNSIPELSHPATTASSSLIRGDTLISYGYAMDSDHPTNIQLTYNGITNQTVKYSDENIDVYGLTKTESENSAGIISGMSGGPVFNSNGDLVGINSSGSLYTGYIIPLN